MPARHSATLLTVLLLAAVPHAEAVETVFGQGDAQACFERARYGKGSGVEPCNRALADSNLTRSDRAATLVNRGIIFNRTGAYDQAVADFNAALEINADLGEAYLNRGNSRFFQKRLVDARTDYDRAIALESRDLHAAYFNRGLVHEALGDPERARADYAEAVRLSPEFAAAQAKLAAAQSSE